MGQINVYILNLIKKTEFDIALAKFYQPIPFYRYRTMIIAYRLLQELNVGIYYGLNGLKRDT